MSKAISEGYLNLRFWSLEKRQPTYRRNCARSRRITPVRSLYRAGR